ncbi:hypothetical protein, partial [Burkholderia cepacia]|uniref:hypothetical protein n=1 Tax=Burkholderia cepacia TaxID=292 RepID=UPI0026E0C222
MKASSAPPHSMRDWDLTSISIVQVGNGPTLEPLTFPSSRLLVNYPAPIGTINRQIIHCRPCSRLPNIFRETLINGPTSEVAGEMASNFLDDEA